jgi:DnaJ-class molecular chaperone
VIERSVHQPETSGTHPPPPTTETRTCPVCRGESWLVEDRSYEAATGTLTLVEVACPRCGGTGAVEVFLYPVPSSRTKSAPCCGCGARLPVRELVEAKEDADLLLILAGDLFCRPCADRQGIAR